MNDEERKQEIREIKSLLQEVQTAARRQMDELERLKGRLAELTDGSKQVEAVEGGGGGLAGHGSL
jgi:hypothetical protein